MSTSSTTSTVVRPSMAAPVLARRAVAVGSRRTTTVLLAVIAAAQAALALRPSVDNVVFADEGLYLYMGHRMIDHLLHGAVTFENPGSYFSGAPGFYPVIAAAVDSVTGLAGVRLLSLACAIGAMIAVHGIGRELFGPRAGVLGAASFAACGAVVFQSHLATYDAFALALLALAGWAALVSARRDSLLLGPAVALVLAAAFFAKYAAAVYALGTAALVIAAAWHTGRRWTVVMRAMSMSLTAVVVVGTVLSFWGASLLPGLRSTTVDRHALAPAPAGDLLSAFLGWFWPWLALGLVGAVLQIRRPAVPIVLLGLGVVGPVQQMLIGESTSLAKHVAFGAVYVAPLVGAALATAWNQHRWAGPSVALLVVLALGAMGAAQSRDFLTGWVDDRELVAVLRSDLLRAPDKVVLGEQPSGQRYQLASLTSPEQWSDTFVFYYDGLEGIPAYQRAVDQSHFGVIYLDLQTPNGRLLNAYLATGTTPYQLTAEPTRLLRGEAVGQWLVWTPTP